MDEDKYIIPLCLYSNRESSLITLPEKIRNGDKNTLVCTPKEGMNFETVFYVVNPDIKPKPAFLDLFCIRNNNNTTVDLFSVYDPFASLDCLKFLAWFEATPCTSPLYIWRKGSKLKITFNENEPEEGFKLDETIPIIFVLLPKDIKAERVGNCNKLDKFTFSISDRRCVPDPRSNESLGKCMVRINEKIAKEGNLLSYLENKKYEQKISIKHLIFLVILIVTLIILLKN